jgi:hypothetical protein
MSQPGNDAFNLYALLIGIDCYLPNRLPDGSYYPSLGGCVRDISQVEAFLKNKFSLSQEHIFKLTATNTGAEKPLEPPEQWPTYENMVAAFKRITELAQAGDRVYIHYSGHGGRAKTIYSDRKGTNGIDEGLVPTNIGYSEARYLRDLELAQLLKDMVDKGIVVAVILDSCHSGGMTRGGGDVAIRGIGTVDTTSRPSDSLVGSAEAMLQTWTQMTGGGTRSVSLGSGWLPEPKGYTLMAACRPSESAYEAVFEGQQRNGALTYWLLNSLGDAGPGLSYKILHDRIVTKVHSQFENQTPQLQGEGDRAFFGSERVQPQYAAPVMQVDTANNRLLLGAGQAQGLRQGAQFAVYPRGSDLSRPELRQAVLQLAELGAADSWATITERFGQQPIEQGAQAVLLGAGAVRLVQKVWLAQRDDLPGQIDQTIALQAVQQALPGNGWVELAAAGGGVDYNVAVNAQGEYEIWDRTGQVIKNLRPALKAGAPNAAVDVVRRLVHLAKYNAVKQLANHDANSPLARKLVVEWAGKRAAYDPADPFEPEAQFTEPGGTPTLAAGEWVALRFKNMSPQKLNVTVLDLEPQWSVRQAFPAGAGDYFVELEPDQELLLPFQAGLPAGYEEGKDIIKVFATTQTTNFRWLELPALDQPQTRSAGLRSKGTANPLEDLLSAFTAEQPPKRSLTPAASPSHGWTVAQVEVTIKKAG